MLRPRDQLPESLLAAETKLRGAKVFLSPAKRDAAATDLTRFQTKGP
jgi:hypothetical protein